jgi:DNA polymerase I-like protein with 3'-5' exonuclease and polymerase domains
LYYGLSTVFHVTKYLNKPEEWQTLINYIYEDRRPFGFDTEFTEVDFNAGENCVGRSVLDVWSIGLYTGELHPRGYEKAKGFVLPSEALSFFKTLLEDESIKKPAHNSTVDVHTCYNAGVDVRGIIDTLHLCRFVFPGRFKYGIDALSREFLDEQKFTSYGELCSIPKHVEKEVTVRRCECGVDGCRKRKGHTKYDTTETILIEQGTVEIPISMIQPGSPRWLQKKKYAAQDAVLALELYDFAVRKLKRLKYDNPFR